MDFKIWIPDFEIVITAALRPILTAPFSKKNLGKNLGFCLGLKNLGIPKCWITKEFHGI
jgi:hypothetical protein